MGTYLPFPALRTEPPHNRNAAPFGPGTVRAMRDIEERDLPRWEARVKAVEQSRDGGWILAN